MRIRTVTIEITNKCNWKCIHCYHDEKAKRRFNLKDYDVLFRQLRKLGVEEINFTGGEVFAEIDFFNIVEMAREMFFKVNILSNISLLNVKTIEKLKELYIAQIDCTIFAMDKGVHNLICGRKDSDQLAKVKDNVILLRKHNIPVLIKTPIMKMNYDQLDEIKRFAKENKCGFKVDCTIFPTIEGDCSVVDYNIDKKLLYKNIKLYDEINGVDLKNVSLERGENCYYCKALLDMLCIDCQGDVFPCVNYRRKVGNFFEESIESILMSPIYDKIIKTMWAEVEKCFQCDMKELCVPCIGLNYSANKDEKLPFKKICEKTECRKKVYEKIF